MATFEKKITSLEVKSKFKESVVHKTIIPARDAINSYFDTSKFHSRLHNLIEKMKFNFYSHQATALNWILEGNNVIISTPTASGKSICYIFPILDMLLKSNAKKSALLVFPLKALAQDQYNKIKAYLKRVGLEPTLVGVYDADTTAQEKRKIRNHCKIIITNPYGLHHYLGHLSLWKNFYEQIGVIVFDEVHVYTGVFGSNIAFVMRRLRRAAKVFGQEPSWIFCSATIGNPIQLAERLSGLHFKLVDKDGMERNKKHIWFWNPIFLEHLNKRLSYHQDTRHLFKELILKDFQTLVFAQSRKMAELQARWARDAFTNTQKENQIMAYRAGYPAKIRRNLEKKLRQRNLIGISATSALELGIDIGSLDIVIMSGFPGSITSFWQRAGRCGRASQDALVVFIAGSDALDQFYINNPEYFFNKRHEEAIIDLENPYILKGHLECAVKEHGLQEDELSMFGKKAPDVLKELQDDHVIHKIGSKYFYIQTNFPASDVPLSSIPENLYKVFEFRNGKKKYLTTETESRTFSSLHEGAIFLFMTETYRVENLDLEHKEVILRKDDVDFYTEPLYETEIVPVQDDGGECLVPIQDASATIP